MTRLGLANFSFWAQVANLYATRPLVFVFWVIFKFIPLKINLCSGKCQNGGELRLSELTEKLDGYHLPEGFCLVGAKSPMLSGMMLVAAVDKRYLPGGANTVTMLGFTGEKKLFQIITFKDFNRNNSAGIITCENLIENFTVILVL